MSVITETPRTAHTQAQHAPRRPFHSAPKRARSGGRPYTPGMFDALIDQPVLSPTHAPPEQIRGVTIELAAFGRSVIVAEQLHSGAGPRHLLTLEEPHSVFMRLADGREVWIEVRAVEQAPEEDREPWGVEASNLGTLGTLVPTPMQPPAFACPDFIRIRS